MSLIETYQNKEVRHYPFVIRDGWQVAQLNYTDEQHIENIDKIEIHNKTEEVFVLLTGRAVLILTTIVDDVLSFEVTLMKSTNAYNIPVNVWHNIAMEKGSEVLIVEKSNKHLGDIEYFYLNEKQKADLNEEVSKAFNRRSLLKKKINLQIRELWHFGKTMRSYSV